MGLITREQAVQEAMAMFNPTGRDWGHEQQVRERVPKPKPDSRTSANAAAAVEQMGRRSRERIEQLENARSWAEHYGALSLAAHDRAARFAEQRDKALALVAELETTGRNTV